MGTVSPLSVILIGSIALNILLAWFVVRRLFSLYAETKGRRRQRFLRRISHFAVKPITHNDIIFLGDSITEGGEWKALFPNHAVRNFGIGSDTTHGVLDRIEFIVAGQPKAIFLLIGTNDIGTGIPQAETIRNYQSIIKRIREGSPKTQLYIQNILPRQASDQSAVEALNQQLQQLAAQHKATYIDLYSQFIGEHGGIKADYSNDELHLLGLGYRRWQQIIAEPLERATA